jgi:NAD(P)-dependent dehydrogenase (short-subunit alcohol dehydrogenase family)
VRAVKIDGQVVVITGAGGGIGRSMARRFHAEKAKAIVVADVNAGTAEAVAKEVGGVAMTCDVTVEAQLQKLIADTLARFGRIDLFCSNAGFGLGTGVNSPDSDWQRVWSANVMSHVWAMRALLPAFTAQKGGYFLITSSAAGLLTMVGDAAYSVSKHGAVALAEWLSITYGSLGVKVSALCPLFVNTPLLQGALAAVGTQTLSALGRTIEPEEVADAVVKSLEAETFFILPHPEVAELYAKKVGNRDRWLASMRKHHG